MSSGGFKAVTDISVGIRVGIGVDMVVDIGIGDGICVAESHAKLHMNCTKLIQYCTLPVLYPTLPVPTVTALPSASLGALCIAVYCIPQCIHRLPPPENVT